MAGDSRGSGGAGGAAHAGDDNEDIAEWMVRLFPDKEQEKIERWVQILEDQEFDRRGDLRPPTMTDTMELLGRRSTCP